MKKAKVQKSAAYANHRRGASACKGASEGSQKREVRTTEVGNQREKREYRMQPFDGFGGLTAGRLRTGIQQTEQNQMADARTTKTDAKAQNRKLLPRANGLFQF
jgi:hypothetical protein